jgi:hypothetical protein
MFIANVMQPNGRTFALVSTGLTLMIFVSIGTLIGAIDDIRLFTGRFGEA